MSGRRRTIAGAGLIVGLLLAGGFPLLLGLPTAGAALAPHAPISISGNAGFNATNGVVSGSGTATDPYVIAGWTIDAPPLIGLQIRNTDAHVIVRDVQVASAPTDGFYFFAVSNLTLSNVTALSGAGEGIRFESSRDVSVEASNVTFNEAGIVVLDSVNVSVASTKVMFNLLDGVTVSGSSSVLVRANDFKYNGLAGGIGLDLLASTNVTVRANRFVGNDISLDGTTADEFASHTITADNLVSGLPILYVANRVGVSFTGLDLGELLLANCVQATLFNTTIGGGDLGIEVAFSSEVVLGPNVTLSDASLGLRIVSSSRVSFVGGAILNTATGASVESSTDVLLSGTKVSAPFPFTLPFDGVSVVGSNRVNLTGNVIRHHRDAVAVVSSGNVSLVANVLSLNRQAMNLTASRDLLVLDNLVFLHGTALRADGVRNATFAGNAFEASSAVGANVTMSSGLRFTHNAFVGDTSNSYDGNGSADAWDGGYPTGGNFWWNYHGFDSFHGPGQNLSGADGIGDTPYLFNENAVDRYPLMQNPVTADVPPEALFVVTPLGGTVITPITANANLSSDYEDVLSDLRVRWDWESNGSWTPWTTVKFARHTYGVAGVHALRLEVRDLANLTDTWTQMIFVAPKADTLPPTINATPPAPVDVGQSIAILANVSDPSGVVNATLLYRGVGESSFIAIPMETTDGTNFTAMIPAQSRAGVVEYVIVANDTWQNEARAPLSGYSVVSIVDPVATLLLYLGLPTIVGMTVALTAFFIWRRRRRKPQPAEEKATEPPAS